MRWAKQRTTTRITRTVEIDTYTVGQPYRWAPHGTTCLLTPSTGISIAYVAGAPVGVRTDAVAFDIGSAQKIAPKSGGSHSARVVISSILSRGGDERQRVFHAFDRYVGLKRL